MDPDWSDHARKLRELLKNDDVANFRDWDIIRQTCHITGPAKWMNAERKALLENGWDIDKLTHTEVHQYYHAMMMEKLMGIEELGAGQDDNFVEIGGGYGVLASALASPSRANYTIIDIPEMLEIQRYNLGPLAEDGMVTLITYPSDAVVDSHTLVIALWSLSELDEIGRKEFLRVFDAAGAWFVAYQKQWQDIDNVAWFEENLGGERLKIEHPAGNYYGWENQHI